MSFPISEGTASIKIITREKKELLYALGILMDKDQEPLDTGRSIRGQGFVPADEGRFCRFFIFSCNISRLTRSIRAKRATRLP